MDFLALTNRLASECGVTGTHTSVVGATGEWKRLVDWTAQAWVEIQEEEEWEWMRNTCTFNTVATKGEYTPLEAGITDFASWRRKSFRSYLTSAGVGTELSLNYKDYGAFRDYYILASRKITFSRPTEITIAPNKNLILGLAPSDIYTVSGEYYKTPVQLALDTDTPDFPTRFHLAIVYKAMMSYGGYEAATEVYARGEINYKAMLNKMRRAQLPDITRGGSLI